MQDKPWRQCSVVSDRSAFWRSNLYLLHLLQMDLSCCCYPQCKNRKVMSWELFLANVEIPEHQNDFLAFKYYHFNKLIIFKHILIICHMDRQCNNNISGKAFSTSELVAQYTILIATLQSQDWQNSSHKTGNLQFSYWQHCNGSFNKS